MRGPTDRPAVPKAGERIAAEILRDISAKGWPVGALLGSENALIERYRVSRAVLREAIRQLEQRGVARMRRGRAGGLEVALPLEQATVRAMAGYLEAIDVDLRAILEAQFLLEAQAASLAAERIDRAGAERLRMLAASLPAPTGDAAVDAPPHTELRVAIAEAAGNRVLALFIRALNISSIEIRSMLVGPAVSGDYRARVEQSIADKRLLVEAIVGVAPDRARRSVEQDMCAQLDLFDRLARSDVQRRELRALMRDQAGTTKLGQALMLRMAEEVARAGAAAGTRLGSEAEMRDRYGVSRAVFREALRLLEQHGVVRMRRGVGGGLFVGRPDMTGTIAMAADHFRAMALRPGEAREVRTALQIGMVDLATTRGDAIDVAAREPDAIGREMARRTGNVVLELLTRVLIEIDPLADTMDRRALAAQIGAALAERDNALARRMMKAMLET